MVMPNFFLIGAMKAGTTSVHHYLGEHPEIFTSALKEPRFFAFDGRGSYSGPGNDEFIPVGSLEAYCSLFDGVRDEKAIGEASTVYLYSPNAASGIRARLPHASIVAVLRDPVDRAYSNYLYMVRRGYEPLGDFRAAVQAEKGRIHKNWHPVWHYVNHGFYYEQLKRYLDVFPASQIKVCLYDDLVADPVSFVQGIFRFLQVNETFVPDVSRRYNEGRIPRNRTLHQALVRPNPVKSLFKLLVAQKLRRRLEMILRERNLRPAPPLAAELRARLRKVYRKDILQLQNLIQRDLSRWLA
jgi:hypothetical protein